MFLEAVNKKVVIIKLSFGLLPCSFSAEVIAAAIVSVLPVGLWSRQFLFLKDLSVEQRSLFYQPLKKIGWVFAWSAIDLNIKTLYFESEADQR